MRVLLFVKRNVGGYVQKLRLKFLLSGKECCSVRKRPCSLCIVLLKFEEIKIEVNFVAVFWNIVSNLSCTFFVSFAQFSKNVCSYFFVFCFSFCAGTAPVVKLEKFLIDIWDQWQDILYFVRTAAEEVFVVGKEGFEKYRQLYLENRTNMEFHSLWAFVVDSKYKPHPSLRNDEILCGPYVPESPEGVAQGVYFE